MNREVLSSSKLQYYPTDTKECWRIAAIIGDLQINVFKENDYRPLLDEFETKAITKGVVYYNVKTYARASLYNYLLDNKKYTEIEHLFTLRYPVSYIGKAGKENLPIVFADLFAGEGRFLSVFKHLAAEPRNVFLVANEIEKNRYEAIVNDKNIDEHYNLAFEELQMPKHSINVMLFNPPYTNVGDERSAVIYFQDIINKKIMIDSNYSEKSRIVLVLREDDLRKCIPLITKNCNVVCCYCADNQVFKQFFSVVEMKTKPLGNSLCDVTAHSHEIDKLKDLVDQHLNFDPIMAIENFSWFSPIDFQKAKENLFISNHEIRIESNPDDKPWQFIRELTGLNDETKIEIVMPRPPKVGEIANLLAAGQLNSVMEMPDGGSHVVIGGTKIIETRQYQEIAGRNNKEDSVIIIRKHEPFLNILTVDKDGTPSIIELNSKTSNDGIVEN